MKDWIRLWMFELNCVKNLIALKFLSWSLNFESLLTCEMTREWFLNSSRRLCHIVELISFFEFTMYIDKTLVFLSTSLLNNLILMYFIIASLILSFNVVTSNLYWFIFRYNLLYVLTFSYNIENQFYSTALKQLFTDVYMMKLYLINCFLFIRDDQNVFIDLNQIVIIIIVITLTIIYQLFLKEIFYSILKHLSAFLINRENEEKELNWNHSSISAFDHLRLLKYNYDWLKSFKKVV